MPTWKERRVALNNLLPNSRPLYGDLYQFHFEPQQTPWMCFKYVEGNKNISQADTQMIDGDIMIICDTRPFKLGRQFVLVYSVRLQRKVYIYSLIFGGTTAIRLERANQDVAETPNCQ